MYRLRMRSTASAPLSAARCRSGVVRTWAKPAATSSSSSSAAVGKRARSISRTDGKNRVSQ